MPDPLGHDETPPPPALSTQPLISMGSSSSSMDSGSVIPGPHSTPGVGSTPCFSTQQVTPCLVTPLSRVKAPNTYISSQQITQGQVIPVSQINATEAASLSSQSANTHPCSNKDNNSFKRLDCTPPTANSSTPLAVSTLLMPGPGSLLASISRCFQSPWVLTAKASARSCHQDTRLITWSALWEFLCLPLLEFP